MRKVALIGYGSFGKAMGTLLDQHGWAWKAHDSAMDETASLEATLAGAEVVVLAVREAELSAALDQIQPWLSEDGLVMDVCARKLGPCALLAEKLGADVRHVGCHPRFGARSLELGLPREVTVCSSEGAPGSLQAAEAFWESLGCRVVVQRAELNDQAL